MGQIQVNNTGLRYARESSIGVLPGSPDWKDLEPDNNNSFGATFTSVARSPISNLAQRRKGTITGLDAGNDYDGDLTIDALVDFTEAFCRATAVNADCTFIGADAVSGGFTVPAATAAQAAKFQYTAGGPISLVHAAGYVLDANNSGVHTAIPLSADLASTDTTLQVAGNAAETAPTNAEVSLCGIRAEAGDLAIAVASGVATITSGNNSASNNVDFTTIGITAGQRLHWGGTATANRSMGAASVRSFGSGRVLTIAAGTVTMDKLDSTVIASDGTDDNAGGTNVPVDLLFGRFVRNVAVDHADYASISYHFEQSLPNLFETDPPTPVANPDGFEYVTGGTPAVWTWNFALEDKATASFSFIGINSEDPVDNASRKTNASTSRLPLHTGALNTATDFFRLRVEDVDETGLTTDFSDMTVTINGNVSTQKVLGQLAARFINKGNFELDIAATALFTSALVPARIRNNTTVSMDWMSRNDDGAVAVDVPSATLSSDGKQYPVNEHVQIGLTVQSFVDPTFNSSIGVSFFPVFPTS